ncbi:hypothetical protein H8959_014020 [Pygathrix nigripes]
MLAAWSLGAAVRARLLERVADSARTRSRGHEGCKAAARLGERRAWDVLLKGEGGAQACVVAGEGRTLGFCAAKEFRTSPRGHASLSEWGFPARPSARTSWPRRLWLGLGVSPGTRQAEKAGALAGLGAVLRVAGTKEPTQARSRARGRRGGAVARVCRPESWQRWARPTSSHGGLIWGRRKNGIEAFQ